jgi:hypothetical protein
MLTLLVTRCERYGQHYPTAVMQLFAGIYCMQICVIGLFFLIKDENGVAKCAPHGIILIIVLLCTAYFHQRLRACLHPALQYLPLSLSVPAYKEEKIRKRSEENCESTSAEEDPDLRLGTQLVDRELQRNGTQLFDMLDNLTFDDLSEADKRSMSDLLFQQPALRASPAYVWIPRDQLDVSYDQLLHMRQKYDRIRATCEGTDYTDTRNAIYKRPPDFEILPQLGGTYN